MKTNNKVKGIVRNIVKNLVKCIVKNIVIYQNKKLKIIIGKENKANKK